eukprot:CAMPEP_0118929856 /NCGR_PEP_ID=MMETSP1169-20130426/6731_1 /TAXON_ID=36882 /ORGANISM="Pyramimonas obovata, Strain CCMP722" /LENGTH=685 /DNA_ID=CAMNT_0006872117 /DNA_START=228 /DNA_END=2286 /DNA_ORIENTATION=+
MTSRISEVSSDTGEVPTEEPQKRERWSGRVTFLLAAIGSAVGTGNLWRFPYLNFKYGGGAFMLPYAICLFSLGIPLLLLELGMGQVFQGGQAKAMDCIHPRLRGFGLSTGIAAFAIATYYNAILSWTVVYFFSTLSAELPWKGEDMAERFFYQDVLERSDSISQVTKLAWKVENAMALVWYFLYLATRRGVKSAGWVVSVTMPLPLVLLLVILLHGITKPGAGAGIHAYIGHWDLSALNDPQMWQDAAGQVVLSLSCAQGTMVAYSSWNDARSTTLVADNYIIACSNSAVSIFAGFAVYSVLGHMAHVQGKAVTEVVASGPGLAFVTYPRGLLGLPGAHLFSLLFFVILFTLGVDSAISMLEAFSCVVKDSPLGARFSMDAIMAAMCLAGFFASLLYCTDAGYYYVDLMDHYMIAYLLLAIALVECVSVGWIYRLRHNAARAGAAALLVHLFSYLLGALLFVALLVGRGSGAGACAAAVAALLGMAGGGLVASRALYLRGARQRSAVGAGGDPPAGVAAGEQSAGEQPGGTMETRMQDEWWDAVVVGGMNDFVRELRHCLHADEGLFWTAFTVNIKYVQPVALLLLIALGLQKDIQGGGYGGYSTQIQATTVATLFTVVFSSGVLVAIFPQLTVTAIAALGQHTWDRATSWIAHCWPMWGGQRSSDRQSEYRVHVDDDMKAEGAV